MLDVLQLFDYLGTAAFAMSGALKAARHQLDLFGVVVLALITAVGGGTLRDLMLGVHPPFWLADPVYVGLGLLLALMVFAWPQPVARQERQLVYYDAVGLGVFTVIGASKALEHGAGIVGAVVFGCLTGVGGGVLRDVLVREVPLVLRKEIYASATVAGSLVFCLLHWADAPEWGALLLGAALVVLIRVYCILSGRSLPRPRMSDD
jgi:uncharacterized membrane protein YeiH